MKTISVKSKQASVLLGVIAMVTVVTLAPHAFAQQNPAGQGQQNGIPLGTPTGTQFTPGSGGIEEPSTAGSDPTPAYTTGIAIMGIMSGIGVWSAVRKH